MSTRSALPFFLLFLVSPSAVAQELPAGFMWSFADDELLMTIEADDLISDIEITLEADGREVADASRSSLAAGESFSFSTPAPDETTEYYITIEGIHADEPASLSGAFVVEIYPPLEFEIDESTWDPDARRFEMTMNQPAQHVELTVRGTDGGVLTERVVEFGGESPGTPLTITWSQPNEDILTIDVKAVSTSGAWSSNQYIPWQVEFEAVHINFASGSAEIPEADHELLMSRLDEIQQTAEGVREFVEVKLYVAGYTDTVGSGADNQSLSEERAQSLAEFFLSRGLDMPVFYQGFGERGLAVDTGDEVDEPENRRAIFILTTRPPPTSGHIPSSNWRSLN